MINQPNEDPNGTKRLFKLSEEFEQRAFHDAVSISMSGREVMHGTIKTAAAQAALNQVFEIEKKKREEDQAFYRRWLASQLAALQDGLAATEDRMDMMLAEHLSEDEMNHLAQYQDDKDRYYQEADALMREKLERGEISQDDYERWFDAMAERAGFQAAIAEVQQAVAEADGLEAKTTVANGYSAETLESGAESAQTAEDRGVMEDVAMDKVEAGQASGQSQWGGLQAKLP